MARRVTVERMQPFAHRGRKVSEIDVGFIRELIAAHPTASRRALSRKLCEAWDWMQPNGELCDAVARGLMLRLHRSGQIELPPARWTPRDPTRRKRPPALDVDRTPLCGRLDEIGPLELRQVRRTADEPLFNALIERYHYLGYTQPVGAHLKYLVWANDRPVACLGWSSAPRHLGARDRFIGWSAEARRKNIRFIAYNPRYLILPWVSVPHLASHVLGRMARVLVEDWERVYGHRLYFLETFVDPQRHRGTCYRAANWQLLGRTTGRGKDDQTGRPNRSIKQVLGYPLSRRFRERLSALQ
jgi:hypothetical protein